MNTVLLSAIIWLPVLLTVLASVVSWGRLRHRALFVVVGTLSLFGLQGIAAPVAVGVFIPGTDGLTRASVHAGFVESIQLSGVLVLVLGSLLLRWLARAFKSEGKECNAV